MTVMTPSAVHIDVPLTNLTTAYLQEDSVFIADRVFPNVPVSKQSDKYYVWPKGQFNRIGDVKPLAPGAEAETISLTASTDSYFCVPYALGFDLTEQMLANEDTQLDTRLAASKALTTKLLLKRELDWISTYFAASVWATEYTGVSNANNDTVPEVTQWDDYTNATPIIDITEAKTAMLLASGGAASVNDIVMVVTQDVRDKLVNHPSILARLNGGATVSNPALVTEAKLAEILGVSEFIVIRAIQNTGKEGLSDSHSFVATKKAALYSRPKAPGLMVPAAGYNFTWSAGMNAGHGVSINSYKGEHLAIKHVAEKVEAVMCYDQKVVSADMGVFFNSIIS